MGLASVRVQEGLSVAVGVVLDTVAIPCSMRLFFCAGEYTNSARLEESLRARFCARN
jgi:hypothetical protein